MNNYLPAPMSPLSGSAGRRQRSYPMAPMLGQGQDSGSAPMLRGPQLPPSHPMNGGGRSFGTATAPMVGGETVPMAPTPMNLRRPTMAPNIPMTPMQSLDESAKATRQADMYRAPMAPSAPYYTAAPMAPVGGYARITTDDGQVHERQFPMLPPNTAFREREAKIQDERAAVLRAPATAPIERQRAETKAITATAENQGNDYKTLKTSYDDLLKRFTAMESEFKKFQGGQTLTAQQQATNDMAKGRLDLDRQRFQASTQPKPEATITPQQQQQNDFNERQALNNRRLEAAKIAMGRTTFNGTLEDALREADKGLGLVGNPATQPSYGAAPAASAPPAAASPAASTPGVDPGLHEAAIAKGFKPTADGKYVSPGGKVYAIGPGPDGQPALNVVR